MVQDSHPVGQQTRLFEVVGHENDRDRQRAPQLDELAQQLAAGDLIDGRKRLVQQQHLRIARQGAGDRHALLLAARQFGRAACLETFEIGARQPLACLCRALARRQMLQRQRHVGECRQMRKQRVVLKDEADAAPLRRHIDAARGVEPGGVAAAHVATRGSVQPGEATQDGRLATARRPHQRQQFAPLAGDVGGQRDRSRLLEAGEQAHRRPSERPSRLTRAAAMNESARSSADMPAAAASLNACAWS